jgi:hypothetical protein
VSTTGPVDNRTPASSLPTVPAPATSSTSSPTAPTTSTTATAGSTIEIEVAEGTVSGPDRIEVLFGSDVTLLVTADTEDEIHVHGYDITGSVTPAMPGTVTFLADIPGVFDVEFENAGLLLVVLEVR